MTLKLNPIHRVTNAIQLAELSFQDLQVIVQKYRGKAISEGTPEIAEVTRYFEQLEEDLISLVHLDNTQLYHPYVRHYLLSWPNNKRFLRKLHRGLEVGVRRQITEKELVILIAIFDGQEKRWSLHRIQKSLENKGLIGCLSRQAFHKLVKRLLSLAGRTDFYNASAVPQKPRNRSALVEKALENASANLQALYNAAGSREVIDREIQDRSERRKKLFFQKPQP
jgi:hypothetical protein